MGFYESDRVAEGLWAHQGNGQNGVGRWDGSPFVLLADAGARRVLYADGVNAAFRSFLAEPRATPLPPRRISRDWWLVVAIAVGSLVEIVFRNDVLWPPVAVLLAIATATAMLFRRTHPLGAVAVVFGFFIVIDVAALGVGNGPVGFYTSGFILVLSYSLFRWGSGREAAGGLMFMLVLFALGLTLDYTGIGDAIAAGIFFLFPAALATTVRYRTTSRARERDQIRFREREQLARELHDTVAHHVAAIAIQAQAGRTVAASDPETAVQTLQVIEEEASRTLAEMRVIVGMLREDSEVDLTPLPGVADLKRLAGAKGNGPLVEVRLEGDLERLEPALGAAVYRLAQESITNAVRHARNATKVDVSVVAHDGGVILTVTDDGDLVAADRVVNGYGLLGMQERTSLLGGTLEAGPAPGRGWTVKAELPRSEPSQ